MFGDKCNKPINGKVRSNNMSRKIKNVCIYGIGGVGGYFGGIISYKLMKAKQGMQVFYVGRGKHLEAVQKYGLYLITDNEEFRGVPNIAKNNVRHMPIPDLYILCVKGYDLDSAVISISKNMNKDTIILPLLNGVDIYERIRMNLKHGIVLPACVYISSSIEKPGTVRQRGPAGRIVFGKDLKYPGINYNNIMAFFTQMGINHTWFDNPYLAIWSKYVFISAFSLMTAYTGKTIGEVIAEEKLGKMTEAIMQEVVLVGKAKLVDFDEDIVEKTIKIARDFPYETKTSFQRDYEKKGAKNEGDIFGGTLIRLAEQYNISIPVTTKVYEALLER